MNDTFQNLTSHLFRVGQATSETQYGNGNSFQNIGNQLGRDLPNLLYAILILIIGWIIAIVAASVVKGVLSRTNIDNRLAASVTGRRDGAPEINVEKWISTAVFWLIMIFVLVAFLNQLQLSAVSAPLNDFLSQIFAFLPKLGGAAILLGVAWIVATLSKLLLVRGLSAFNLDEKLNQAGSGSGRTPGQMGPPSGSVPPGTTSNQINQPTAEISGTQYPGASPSSGAGGSSPFLLSDTLGNALYWFIFLLFLPAILNVLGLQGTLQPVQGLLNEILGILPNILAAILIGVAGWFVARIVRIIVTNLLMATGVDQIGSRFGLGRTRGSRGLSWLIGTIVYVLILIPAAIAALNALQLDAVSRPASNVLQQILNAIPLIFTAGLILAVAYVLGKFVADLVTNILTSVGFDNVFAWLGLQDRPRPGIPPTAAPITDPTVPPGFSAGSAVPSNGPLGGQAPGFTQPEFSTAATRSDITVPTKTPSEIAGIIVLVGIMLFATVTATNVLGFAALTAIVTGLIVILGRILAGLAVFAVGLYLANLAFRLIESSGTNQANILAQTARIAIIALVSAMALQQMGIASNIVNLAFGLLLGAIAVAVALAFGLGSMDIAAEQVREWLSAFKRSR